MDSNSQNIVPHIYAAEGGWVNDPADAGGETNKGITYRVWCDFFGSDSHDRFMEMSIEDWQTIYIKGYWDKCRCSELPQAVADIVAEYAFMSGPSQAIRTLQTSINKLQGSPSLKVDGVIGSMTIAAAKRCNLGLLCKQLFVERRLFYVAIIARRPANARFRNGWENRLKALEAYIKKNYSI